MYVYKKPPESLDYILFDIKLNITNISRGDILFDPYKQLVYVGRCMGNSF